MTPLVVTLAMDAGSQRFFDGVRSAEFPPERNHLAAHITLFHAVPDDDLQAVVASVTEMAARPSFTIEVTGLRFLGGGVAYALASRDLDLVRKDLASRWRGQLTRQDQQPHRAHITVQNKVAAGFARATYERLALQPLPPPIQATGISVWRYLGGPWEPVETVAFAPSLSSA